MGLNGNEWQYLRRYTAGHGAKCHSLTNKALSPYEKDHAWVMTIHFKSYQKHENMIHLLTSERYPMFYAWPFAQWGLDIVGPLKRDPSNKRFLLFGIDYFTKWIEV